LSSRAVPRDHVQAAHTETVDPFRPFLRYPVLGLASIIDCPIHRCAVALDDQGRLCSECPECRREAEPSPTRRGNPFGPVREAARTMLDDAIGWSLSGDLDVAEARFGFPRA